MTEKTKSVPRSTKKQHGRTKPVMMNESVARLIESELERAEVVLAAKGITSKLQDMAENLSKLEANDIMPMLDTFRQTFGQPAADQFSQVSTAKIRELISAVQACKSALDHEVSRLEQLVNGGDGSDAAMDAPMPPPPPLAGEAPPAPEGEVPGAVGSEAPGVDAPVPMPPVESPLNGATGFAGRARKESVKPKGRKLVETNSTETPEFMGQMEAFGQFSLPCVEFARDILDQIHDLAVSGEVRNKLVNALGHVLSMSSVPEVWDDPEAVASHGVATHFTDGPMGEVAKTPEITKVLKDIHKLAHMVSMKHAGHLREDDALAPMAPPAAPIMAPAPPASPLAPGPVFENRRQAKNIKRLRESRNPDKLILAIFRNVLRECRNVGLAVKGTACAFGIDSADVVTIIREAKHRVSEDAVPALMGVEMGQPDPTMNNANAGQNPTALNPVPGKPNKPLTPADMRAAKQARDAQDQVAKANGQPLQPITAPKAPVAVQQVNGQQKLNPVISPQMRQQQRANRPNMPGKIVNNGNINTV